MIRQNTTNATLLGMTAVAIGTCGSLPERNPWDSVSLTSTGTETPNISFFKFNGGQGTWQNFGATSGDEPQTSSTRLASFVEVREEEKPGLKGEEATFPQKLQSDGTVVFDNFGDPSYTKLHWKSTGDCWPDPDSIANSGKMFKRHHPEISLGDYPKPFAITFNFKSAETGGAISDEFKITTSQISFDIGGGTSKSTKFELLVEGKEYASASGAGGPGVTFRRARFTTKEVIGKTGRFRITDNGTEKGDVIAVGNITGENNSTENTSIKSKSATYTPRGPTLGELGVKDYLLTSSTEKYTFPYGKQDFQPVYDVGVSPTEHESLIDQVSTAVYRSKTIKSDANFKSIAKSLDAVVVQVMTDSGCDVQTKPILYKWLKAEAVGAYEMSRIAYATEQGEPSFDPYERSKLNEPSAFMTKNNPRAVCSGFTRLAAIVSRELGLTCYHIDGFTRSPTRDWNKPNHGWLLYDFGNGIRVPSDVTSRIHEFNSNQTLSDFDLAKLKKKYSWRVMPKTVRDFEMFSCFYFQFRLGSEEKQIPPNLTMTRLSFDEWKNLNNTPEVLGGYYKCLSWLQKDEIAQINSTKR